MGLPHWKVPSSPPKASLPAQSRRPARNNPATSEAHSRSAIRRRRASTGLNHDSIDAEYAHIADLMEERMDQIDETESAASRTQILREADPGMETLGRLIARTHRRAREQQGAEASLADEAGYNGSWAQFTDPLTWRTRADGSVIPPSMESSHGQPLSQPQADPQASTPLDLTARAEAISSGLEAAIQARRSLEARRRQLRRRMAENSARLTPSGRTPQGVDGSAQQRIEAAEFEQASRMFREAARARDALMGSDDELTPTARHSRLRRELIEAGYVRSLPGDDEDASGQERSRSPMVRNEEEEPGVLRHVRRFQRRLNRQRTSAGGGQNHDEGTVQQQRRPVDGLGDRSRSLSPGGDNAWDTLLTTISPDPQPPSVGSSFTSAMTSAAASAGSSSFGARSNASSAATSVDDDGGPSQFFENICETFESRGSDSDEEQIASGTARAVPVAGSPVGANEMPMDASLDIFWSGYTEVVTRRAERVAAHSGVTREDGNPFSGMQRIVQRLAGREDIPDEWWATAGLARIVERTEQ